MNIAILEKSENLGIHGEIFDFYDFELYDIEPIDKYCWNYHFKLETNLGRMCLKKYRGILNDNDIIFQHLLINHLINKGFEQTVKPLNSKYNQSFVKIDKNYYFISHWIDDICEDNKTLINEDRIKSAAYTLANIHELLEDFEPAVYRSELKDPCLMDVNLWMEKYQECYDRIVLFINDKLAGFENLKGEDMEYIIEQTKIVNNSLIKMGYNQIKEDSKVKYAYGEFRPANLAFKDNAVYKTLDFDCAIKEIRLYDICFGASSFAGEEDLSAIHNMDNVMLFIKFYHERYPLSEAEINLLPWYMKHIILKWISSAWREWQVSKRLEYYRQICKYFESNSIVAYYSK